jgi:hypothetical protein
MGSIVDLANGAVPDANKPRWEGRGGLSEACTYER